MEWFLNNVIEEKARTKVSSLPYERSEERKGYRNGSRTLKTTDGKLELEKPQIMEFSFIAQVFERYSKSDPINALMNYGYAILESMVRKNINTIGLDVSIGYLHEITPSKHPLVCDLQELFRYVLDYSVIELLETELKRSDFITTENYHIRLKPETSKKLIKKITNNFNKRYEFRNKQHTLENIMFENIRELSRYISGKLKGLEFSILDMAISRNDTTDIKDMIMTIEPKKRKDLKTNKFTLWYQKKKIKKEKKIKIYRITNVKMEWTRIKYIQTI